VYALVRRERLPYIVIEQKKLENPLFLIVRKRERIASPSLASLYSVDLSYLLLVTAYSGGLSE
jgi:hypothetical protein